MIKKLLLGVVLIACLCSCGIVEEQKAKMDKQEKQNIEWQKRVATRNYHQNPQGISYFLTCIEGLVFVATDGYRATALAGPIGACK